MYKTDDRNYGYNLNKGGDGNVGYKHTEDDKLKMSIIAKEIMEDPIKKEKVLENLSKGWDATPTMTDITKQKISDSRKNKKEVYQYDLQLNLLNTYPSNDWYINGGRLASAGVTFRY